WRGYVGSYVPGEKGKRAEDVAQEALNELHVGKDIEVDKHLADQLLLYAALTEGKTEYTTSEITEHTKTNAEIIMKFLNKKIELSGTKILIS
ncbi:MAG: RNA 3'-terminal phosphate cyclase, partial [Candidatus Micrarchaeota archaeon]|nr:RNA 3'-terminal phosphate cyclase [Candidatus Micrarchaeota archaeon]